MITSGTYRTSSGPVFTACVLNRRASIWDLNDVLDHVRCPFVVFKSATDELCDAAARVSGSFVDTDLTSNLSACGWLTLSPPLRSKR